MADALYHRGTHQHGDGKVKKVTAATAVQFKAGDHVILASNVANLASSMADAGTLAQNQEAAHDVYLGVCVSGKEAGVAGTILVASAGVHKLPCAALGAAINVGGYFGLADVGAGTGVSDTIVASVATANLAVGRLAETAAVGATSVLVEIAGELHQQRYQRAG